MFTTDFDTFVSEGDTITCQVDGFTVTARVVHDHDAGTPWEREDGHGPVSEWTSRDKLPSERVLASDGGSYRYYDFASAVRTAKAEGWDAPPYKTGTKAQQAARAVEADFRALKAWCDDEWTYCGVCLTVERAGVQLTDDYANALWGIECNHPAETGERRNAYLREVANDLLDEALDQARAKLEELTEEVA